MDNIAQYYAPEIWEFYVGFEYELLVDDTWSKKVFTRNNNVRGLSSENGESVDYVRVKYLDADDILSLGFVEQDRTEEIIKFAKKDEDTVVNIILASEGRLFITAEYANTKIPKFSGVLRNKSELIRLFNQLGIDG